MNNKGKLLQVETSWINGSSRICIWTCIKHSPLPLKSKNQNPSTIKTPQEPTAAPLHHTAKPPRAVQPPPPDTSRLLSSTADSRLIRKFSVR